MKKQARELFRACFFEVSGFTFGICWADTLVFYCYARKYSYHTYFSSFSQAVGQIAMNFLRTSNNSFFHGQHCLLNFYIAKALHDCRIFAFKEYPRWSFRILFLVIFLYAQFLDVQDFNSITFYEINFKIRPASLAAGADRIRSSASIPIPVTIQRWLIQP